jgi:hypothetical protein
VQETQADLGEGAAMAGRSGRGSAAVARAPRWARESGDRGGGGTELVVRCFCVRLIWRGVGRRR